MRALSTMILALALFDMPAAVSACPNCPTARAARVEVFDQDFGHNLLMALAPFLVVGVVAASVHRSGPRNQLGASGAGERSHTSI
jgi:hypothetical protein